LRTRTIFADEAVTLIAVESLDTQHGMSRAGCHLYARLQPIAIVVCGAGEQYALDMRAEPADLDQLMRDIPELEARLGEMPGAPSPR